MELPGEEETLTMKLVPDERTKAWLLIYWEERDTVTEDTQCPTPLIYEDGSEGRCVLSADHLDIDLTPVDVPHADKDGRLADLLVHRQSILEARYWQNVPWPWEEKEQQ
jgi:hypothetical protein